MYISKNKRVFKVQICVSHTTKIYNEENQKGDDPGKKPSENDERNDEKMMIV